MTNRTKSVSWKDLLIRIINKDKMVTERSQNSIIINMIEKWIKDWNNRARIARQIIEDLSLDISDEYWTKIVSEIIKNNFPEEEVASTKAIPKKIREEITKLLSEWKKPKEIALKTNLHEETIGKIARDLEWKWVLKRKSQVDKIHEYVLLWKSWEEICILLWKEPERTKINTLKENYRLYKKRKNL